MKKVKIINDTTKNVICENCSLADNFFTRFKGLMGKRDLDNNSGLLIKPCKSVHMFFMRFSIDVVFIDCDFVVINVIKGLKPWRISSYVKDAMAVLELKSGVISKKNISIGDKINLLPL